MKDGDTVEVNEICTKLATKELYVVGNVLEKVGDVYTHPWPSSSIGIFIVKRTNEVKVRPISSGYLTKVKNL